MKVLLRVGIVPLSRMGVISELANWRVLVHCAFPTQVQQIVGCIMLFDCNLTVYYPEGKG